MGFLKGSSPTVGYIPKWVTLRILGNSIIYISDTTAYISGGLSCSSDIVTSANFGCSMGSLAIVQLAKGSAPSSPTSAYVRLYAKTDNKLYYKDSTGAETGPLTGGSAFARGSAWVNFSNTPGYVDVNTGLASVSGAVATLHYDMGSGVVCTVHVNYPSAGQIRIYARNVTDTGSLGLDVFWIAW